MAIVIGPGIEIGLGVTMTSPLYDSLAGSLQFNGSSQFLSLVPGFALSTSAYTIEGWFYNNVNYTAQRALVAPQHPSGAANALSLFTLDAAVTTDTSGTQTVTNNGTVTQTATKPF